jgi:hypothetical protein
MIPYLARSAKLQDPASSAGFFMRCYNAAMSKPLRFWQFTIRQLLIFTALVAVLVGILRLWHLEHFGPLRH